MSTFKKGVFGLIVVLACGFAQAGQCISDSAHAYRVFRTIGNNAHQMTFPMASGKGGKMLRCSSSGAIQAGGPCACYVSQGRDKENGSARVQLVFTPISESTIVVSKVSPNGTLLAAETYNAYEGGVANKKNDPCAGLWGEALNTCRAGKGVTSGDVGEAIGTIIKVIPGLFGR